MAKWCFNYESGEYEYIERDGFSIDRGELKLSSQVQQSC